MHDQPTMCAVVDKTKVGKGHRVLNWFATADAATLDSVIHFRHIVLSFQPTVHRLVTVIIIRYFRLSHVLYLEASSSHKPLPVMILIWHYQIHKYETDAFLLISKLISAALNNFLLIIRQWSKLQQKKGMERLSLSIPSFASTAKHHFETTHLRGQVITHCNHTPPSANNECTITAVFLNIPLLLGRVKHHTPYSSTNISYRTGQRPVLVSSSIGSALQYHLCNLISPYMSSHSQHRFVFQSPTLWMFALAGSRASSKRVGESVRNDQSTDIGNQTWSRFFFKKRN